MRRWCALRHSGEWRSQGTDCRRPKKRTLRRPTLQAREILRAKAALRMTAQGKRRNHRDILHSAQDDGEDPVTRGIYARGLMAAGVVGEGAAYKHGIQELAAGLNFGEGGIVLQGVGIHGGFAVELLARGEDAVGPICELR